jgi:hypothetical protein
MIQSQRHPTRCKLGPDPHASELVGTLRVAQQRLGQDRKFRGRSGGGGIVAAVASLDANPCRFR